MWFGIFVLFGFVAVVFCCSCFVLCLLFSLNSDPAGRGASDGKIGGLLVSSSPFLQNAAQDTHLVLARPPRAFH